MNAWENFLEVADHLNPWAPTPPKLGKVMVCFINRYLVAVSDLKVKIVVDGQAYKHQTTTKDYCFEYQPQTSVPIQVYVWSHKRQAYKRLDDVKPLLGQRVLAQKIIKTIMLPAKTREHKDEDTNPNGEPKKTPPAATGPSPTTNQGTESTPKKDENNRPKEEVKRSVPNGITAMQLKRIFVQADMTYLGQIADELNTDLVKYKLDTVFRRAHFFGQIRQESGAAAKGVEESFHYSVLALKGGPFGYYRKHPDEAEKDGYVKDAKKNMIQRANQETIANKVYGPPPGNGDALLNEVFGDGWKYRGRGLKQVTGKRNYRNFTKEYLKYWSETKDFLSTPDLLLEMPDAVRSAVWFWLVNKCYKTADKGLDDVTIDAATRIVNSGEVAKHKRGDYKDPNSDPVLQRRSYTKLAYSAFI